MYADGLPDNGLKELIEKHSRPDNCTQLTEVRLNDLIWVLLNSFNQAQDSRFQIFQNCLVTAGVTVTKLLNMLTKHASGDVSQFVDLGMDALAVLGHGHKQLCLRRRELIKPHLSRQYVHLCSPSVPFTNQLFGSDVDTLIENITNTNIVSNKIVRNNQFQGQGRVRGCGRGGHYLNYRTRGQQPH